MATLGELSQTLPDEKFKEFDVNSVNKKHVYWIIYGCSNSGKSFLTKDLLYNLTNGPDSYWKDYKLISTTENLSHSFNLFSKEQIQDRFSDAWLDNLIFERSHKLRNKEKLEPTLLIFDDCQGSLKNQPSHDRLFISVRHIALGAIVLLQNMCAMSAPPAMRGNATLLGIARPRKAKDRKFIVDEYLSMNNAHEGEQALLNITEGKYNFAICDLSKFPHATKLQDFVYSYKASEVPKSFKLHKKGQTFLIRNDRTKISDEKISELEFL